MIFDPQSPGGTIDRASSITPGTSSDEASTLDGAGTTCQLALVSVLALSGNGSHSEDDDSVAALIRA